MSVMTVRARPLHNSNIRRFNDLCAQKGAINLAQGLCHVECSAEKAAAIEAYKQALDAGRDHVGFDTYTNFLGIEPLRRRIAQKAKTYNAIDADPLREIIVTAGALGAFSCAIDALMRPGEEALLLEPFYSFHRDQLLAKHMIPRAVPLRQPAWSLRRDDLEAVYSTRTRVVVVNTPANPSGKVFSRDELGVIADFCVAHDLLAITDEVYEFMVYDGMEHISLATLPGMWERTITMSSFGKLLSATGWRVGYAIAPQNLIREMGYSNEFEFACAPAPAQHAVAAAIADITPFRRHGAIFQEKRDILCDALEAAGFPIYRPSGAVYVLADVSRFGGVDAEDVTYRLIDNPGVGGVPASDFYLDDSGRQQLRFCFAVTNDQLHEAARRLRAFRFEAGAVSAAARRTADATVRSAGRVGRERRDDASVEAGTERAS